VDADLQELESRLRRFAPFSMLAKGAFDISDRLHCSPSSRLDVLHEYACGVFQSERTVFSTISTPSLRNLVRNAG
jgi:hypothetical protein